MRESLMSLYLYVSFLSLIVHRGQWLTVSGSYMGKGYTKLFQKILDSTIWREDDKTRIVWITMLAMSDQDGVVEAPMPNIADRARVDIPACKAALEKFISPDEYSRTTEFEGRRIEKVGNGYKLLNHKKYREMMSLEHRREYKRVKAQEYREEIRRMDRGKSARGIIKDRIEAENSVGNQNPG